MSYTQFGYAAFTPSTQLMVPSSSSPNSSVSSPCCGEGRPAAVADAAGGVCSLPATYDSRLLTTYHPRLYEHQPYPNFESSAFYPSLSTAYGMKDAADPWRGIAPSASYYYDPSLAAYGYGGLDFNGARRKNVTRDSTSTLKAWLNEHRKNPYPTKGEKIMLAIITKMTLTQVSTWFANARRRLKKENKMTWEPRNKMDEAKDYEDEDEEETKGGRTRGGSEEDSRRCGEDSEDEGDRRMAADDSIEGVGQYSSAGQIRPYHLLPPKPHPEPPRGEEFTPTDSSSSPNLPDIQALMRSSPLGDKGVVTKEGGGKPKIWSLADTATSKSPEPHGGWFPPPSYQGAGGFGGYHAASCSGFVPPQTDTPPQTPPNMKAGYQGGHFYPAAAAAAQGSKSGGYPLSSRSYRPESAPEDYSTGHFRSSTLH